MNNDEELRKMFGQVPGTPLDRLGKGPSKQDQIDALRRQVMALVHNMNDLRHTCIAIARASGIHADSLVDILQDRDGAKIYVEELATREKEIAEELKTKAEEDGKQNAKSSEDDGGGSDRPDTGAMRPEAQPGQPV